MPKKRKLPTCDELQEQLNILNKRLKDYRNEEHVNSDADVEGDDEDDSSSDDCDITNQSKMQNEKELPYYESLVDLDEMQSKEKDDLNNDSDHEDDSPSALEKELEEYMGIHPSLQEGVDADFDLPMAERIYLWISKGVDKKERKQLIQDTPRKKGPCDLSPPKLNDEVSINIEDAEVIKDDNYYVNYHNMVGTSLSLAASAFHLILQSKNSKFDRKKVLRKLSNSIKLSADTLHFFNIARKSKIASLFDKKTKAALQKVACTKYLFGDNVKDLVNSVKLMQRVGKNFKRVAKKSFRRPSSNFRGSFVKRGGYQMNRSQFQGPPNFRRRSWGQYAPKSGNQFQKKNQHKIQTQPVQQNNE